MGICSAKCKNLSVVRVPASSDSPGKTAAKMDVRSFFAGLWDPAYSGPQF